MINVIGGFVIGIVIQDLSVSESLKTYTLLSIGDGLVTQIPALIVSTSAGIIVTRAASTSNMGQDLTGQLLRQPRAIMIAAGLLFFFGLVPGMPTVPFMALGAMVGTVGYITNTALKKKQIDEERRRSEQEDSLPEERTEDLLKVDALEVEIGYGLIPLVDSNQGGDLLDRVSAIRRQLALDLGIIVPPIRIRDNIQLSPNQYAVKVKGIKVAEFELMPDHILAINPGYIKDDIDGFKTEEPAFKLSARWIIPNLKESAESMGYTIVEPSAVMATHLTEIIKTYAADLLTRQDVSHLLETLKEDHPALVENVVPEAVPLSVVQKVLQMLLMERIPVRDMASIMETITDMYPTTKETDVLGEYVRMALKRQITEMYCDENKKLHVFTIDPAAEQALTDGVQNSKQGLMLVIPPEQSEILIKSVGQQVEKMETAGQNPICLCSPNVRLAIKRLLESSYPSLAVLSYNEISNHVEIVSIGAVSLGHDN
jgi:flagellar biosynthesis protein FlhA